MRVALAQIDPIVGDLDYNFKKIAQGVARAREKGATCIAFPEMALLGYPPEDLLTLPSFVHAVEEKIADLLPLSRGCLLIVGTIRSNPTRKEKKLFNTAAVFHEGKLLGFHDKVLLPDYDIFSERRYFEPGGPISVWNVEGKNIAVTICEDLWQHAGAVDASDYGRDPVAELKGKPLDFLINIAASPFYYKKWSVRQKVFHAATKTLQCPLLFVNQVGGNDSHIFDGYSACYDRGGKFLQRASGFKEDLLLLDLDHPPAPFSFEPDPVEDLYNALITGMRDYFYKQGFTKACIGLSGGIDSSVVAVLAAEALGKENLIAVSLPSRFSSAVGRRDAEKLAHQLGIDFKEISIDTTYQTFLDLLNPHFKSLEPDVTEENLQARIRGMILMAFSNKLGYIVLCTGNKSEMAMGYCTLYGDMCGGLGVLSDVSKEQVYALAHYINRKEEIIPQEVIAKPPSAELRFNQKDTDSLPEYPIVDRVLRDYVEDHLSPEEIFKKEEIPLDLVHHLVRKIHLNEYKRRQAPPSLRVTKKAFAVGRRFPIVQHWNL